MSRQTSAGPTAGAPHPGPPRPPSGPPGDGPISAVARAPLDRVLELLERRRLSATDLRVLLMLLDREPSLPELAEALGQRPVEIRRAGRRLAMRGLVRWHHVGRRKETRLAITTNGLATTRALLTATSRAAGEAQTPKMRSAELVQTIAD